MTEGNPMQAKCGALCRTTGQPCKNACMPNGRCRMHGGKSTGRPPKHGFYSKVGINERKILNRLIDGVFEISNEVSHHD